MKAPKCKCGCGERVSKIGNKYVHGHNVVIRKKSVQIKENISYKY